MANELMEMHLRPLVNDARRKGCRTRDPHSSTLVLGYSDNDCRSSNVFTRCSVQVVRRYGEEVTLNPPVSAVPIAAP